MVLKTSATVLALALALVACSGGPHDGAGNARPPKAGERLRSVPDPCGELGDDEAAGLLGISVADLERSVMGPMFDNACSLKSRSQPLKSIIFVLRREDSVSAGRAAFHKEKAEFAVTVAEREVVGLGDEAAWFGGREPVVLKRLLARKGNVCLDVISAPGDLAGARSVAEAVFQKLR
jgi:hypothetical protein